MKINKNRLKVKLPRRMRTLQDGEMFYSIDGIQNYCFSNYFRLCQCNIDKNGKESYKIIHSVSVYKNKNFKCPNFRIVDGTGNIKFKPITELIRKTFFINESVHLLLINSNGLWIPDNVMALSREEWLYRYESITNNAQFDSNKYKIQLPNFGKTNIAKLCNDKYDGMHRRATSESYKKLHPEYRDTVMYSEWIDNPDSCKQYLMEQYYEYPGELVVDKDLMGYGLLDAYMPGIAIFLPKYLNNVFQKSVSDLGFGIKKNQSGNYQVPKMGMKSATFIEYEDALRYAKKSKAMYVNSQADKEEKSGYMPDYIIKQMRTWAALCRDGKMEIWEPKRG